MKKLLLIFVSLVAFCSCENEEFDFAAPVDVQSEVAVDSFYVSFDEALAQAEKALAGTTTTRASVVKRKVANHHEFVASRSTRATGDDVEVRFHVINFEDNEGFALVSADSRTTPVYAYSETGNLDIEDATENTGFGDFMDAATEYYIAETEWTGPNDQLLPINPTTPIIPIPMDSIVQLPIEILDGEVYHVKTEVRNESNPNGILINAEWAIKWPYNYYCGSSNNKSPYWGERNSAGCGPVAAAQIMSYYRYPLSYGDYVFNWDKILSSVRYNDNYPSISEGALATAYFIHKVGVAANAVYEHDAYVTNDDMSQLFEKMGYDFNGHIPYSSYEMRTSLNNSCPVLVSGLKSNSSDGHIWVIDAYNRQLEVKTYYYQEQPHDVYRVISQVLNMYTHCNWGYGYDKNSYSCWCLNVYSSPYGAFSRDIRMIYNIKPKQQFPNI